MHRIFLAFAAWLALTGAVLAQGAQVIPSPTGQEQLPVTNGTLASNVTLNSVRNTTGYQLLGSASGMIAPTNAVDNLLIAAQPAASTTIKTPTAPADGELFAVCNVTSSAWATNTVTLSAATGSSLAAGVNTALTTLAARTCEELQYIAATTTWYQVR